MHDAHTKYKNAEYTKRIYEKAEPVADSPSTRSAVFRLCEPGQRRFICVTTLQLSPQLPMSVGLRHFSGRGFLHSVTEIVDTPLQLRPLP